MIETSKRTKINVGSEKSFGIVFSLVFLIVAIYPLLNNSKIYTWALFVSISFLLLAFLAPKTLSFPNKIWFRFGLFLGSIIAPIVMSLVYLLTVMPTGILMRLLGKDILKQKFDKELKSYWNDRKDSAGSMKDQF